MEKKRTKVKVKRAEAGKVVVPIIEIDKVDKVEELVEAVAEVIRKKKMESIILIGFKKDGGTYSHRTKTIDNFKCIAILEIYKTAVLNRTYSDPNLKGTLEEIEKHMKGGK